MQPSESLWQAGAGPTGVSSATFYNRFRGYLRKAGLPVSGLHVLRHTAAKLRRDVGESVESVSQFLDHSSLAVTTTYLYVASKVSAMPPGRASPTSSAWARPLLPPHRRSGRLSSSSVPFLTAASGADRCLRCWPLPSGCRSALTSSRLPSLHTSRFNSLALEVVLPNPIARIATYARVSSDEQRDRHTVLNQRSPLSRRLSSEPGLSVVFRHYEDDGVSGTIPLEDRPAGRALARDARAGRFSQIWVVRSDRLGRDAFELLRIWRVFESIGVALRATDENIDDPFYFDIHAVIAANERRKFLERSAEGMNRAASEGRYTGGIVPLGYRVSGDRGSRRLVPDDSLMWENLSAADVVRRIYDHLAVDGWTCPRIADEFNSLGIPTSYQPRRSRRQRSSHPGPLALRAYPQPRRQSRLQGHPPVRTTIYQTERTFCDLFFRSPTGVR